MVGGVKRCPVKGGRGEAVGQELEPGETGLRWKSSWTGAGS